jgi:hypothetical protein
VSDYEKFCDFGSGSYYKFIKEHPEYKSKDFEEFVIVHNKADRDSGELQDISLDEVKRLAKEFKNSKADQIIQRVQ